MSWMPLPSAATLLDQLEEEGEEIGIHGTLQDGESLATAKVYAAETIRVVASTGWGLRVGVERERVICSFSHANTLARIYASRFHSRERGHRTRLRLARELRALRKHLRRLSAYAEVREDIAEAKRRGTKEAWAVLVGRRNRNEV